MEFKAGYTDVFMSPVTGELASYNQIPPAEYGEILVANQSGYFSPSLALIDAKIDINSLEKLTNGLNEASVILQKHSPTEFFPNSQVLDDLVNGFLLKEDGGVLSTISAIPPENLELPYGDVFIGNSSNIASPSPTITFDNLPDLGVATVSGLSLPAGKIWRGTSSNRPEESNAVSIMEADILAINARFLLGNFVMGDALVQYTFPNSQFIINLQDGMLKKTGKLLQTAIEGEDYLKELPNLTTDMVWRGDATNRPTESPYVSEERLEELVEQAETAAEEAEASAEEAATAAEEATGAAEEATGAAAESTGAAAESSASAAASAGSAVAAAASATAAAASAVSASSDAGDAEDYANDASNSANHAQTYANNASNSANNAQTSYINLINTAIEFQGDVTGSGPLSGPIITTLTKTLNTINNEGDIDVNNYNFSNVTDPISAQQVATKNYVDLIPKPLSEDFVPVICNDIGQDVIGNPTYGGQGYTNQIGKCIKLGPLVFVEIYIECAGNSYSADETPLYFTGLPYLPRNNNLARLNYSNCAANNIIDLSLVMNQSETIFPINCIYQSIDTSLFNPSTSLKRGAINQFTPDYNTSFYANFFYTTDL